MNVKFCADGSHLMRISSSYGRHILEGIRFSMEVEFCEVVELSEDVQFCVDVEFHSDVTKLQARKLDIFLLTELAE